MSHATAKPLLSVVIPCCNEEEAIPLFWEEISRTMKKLPAVRFELIFVDDGSTDATLAALRGLSAREKEVSFISFSRNFGKEAAMLAGLEAAKGDYVAVMDVDLQDPPEMLVEMYEAIASEGYDCAAAYRDNREGESRVRSFFVRAFYKLINKLSETNIVAGARDYRLMTRQVTDALLSLQEYNRFSKGLFSWVGFNTKWIPFNNAQRVAGSTKWSFWGLFGYAIDGIVGFSTAPLAIASFSGLLFFIISFIMIIFIVIRRLVFGDPVDGWASTICIILFVGGIQLFCVGILGQYMAKNYLETKKRPQYIIKEKNIGDASSPDNECQENQSEAEVSS